MYEINEGTLAVLYADDKGKSKIIEEDGQYIIEENAYKIMDFSCQYFGSSYEGRESGTQSILGSSYKVPVVVEETKNLIFFPTISPSNQECSWISLNQIKDYIKVEHQTKIIFKNNYEIILPISYRSIQNQILRATRLESVMRSRKNL